MKMYRRLLVLVISLVLIFTLSTVAFASASRIFFTQTTRGYSCTGSGYISGTTATANLRATAIPGQSTIPSSDCYSEVWVLAYNSNDELIGSTSTRGTTTATATYIAAESISSTACAFKFLSTDFGLYILEN